MNFNQLKQKIEGLDPNKEGAWEEFANALVASCRDRTVTRYLSDLSFYHLGCYNLQKVCADDSKRGAQLKEVLDEAYKLASDTTLADLLNGFAKKAGINYQHKK